MACATLPADIQGCLNIGLIRGDSRTVTMLFWSDEAQTIPIDIEPYTILMEIREAGDCTPVISSKSPGNGMTVSGNQLNIVFEQNDAVYQRGYKVLFYDIAFTLGTETKHWIKGQILITKSETKTW